jgi:hypothetical protein
MEWLQPVILDIGIINIAIFLGAVAAEIVGEIVRPIAPSGANDPDLRAAEIAAAVEVNGRRILAPGKIAVIELIDRRCCA